MAKKRASKPQSSLERLRRSSKPNAKRVRDLKPRELKALAEKLSKAARTELDSVNAGLETIRLPHDGGIESIIRAGRILEIDADDVRNMTPSEFSDEASIISDRKDWEASKLADALTALKAARPSKKRDDTPSEDELRDVRRIYRDSPRITWAALRRLMKISSVKATNLLNQMRREETTRAKFSE